MTTMVAASSHDVAPSPRLLRWARRLTWGRPHRLVVAGALAASVLAWIAAHAIRFEFALPEETLGPLMLGVPIVIVVRYAAFRWTGVFQILWQYVGIRDVVEILKGTLLGSILLAAAHVAWPGLRLPWTLLLLDGILSFLAVAGLYASLRGLRDRLARDVAAGEAPPERAFIVGAGDSGEALLREIEHYLARSLRVVGFIDDDPDKRHRRLRGVPVLGTVGELTRLAEEHGVRRALIAIPSIGGGVLRGIIRRVLEAGMSAQALPPLGALSAAGGLLAQLRDVAIEDLLRRDPVRLDEAGIREFLQGRRVLITGAAGSIGSELCRQILRYGPSRLVAFDRAETPLQELTLEIGGLGPLATEHGDITDPVRVAALFRRHQPEAVFHAAALKHVPVCEDHPREAVRVNVGGTRVVSEQAVRSGAAHFILISTDKAVNPSSVMGATKRVAELVIQNLNAKGQTTLAAVRFGNVLGSNGSVVGIFKRQLARGGPLTVTHPDMRRYFMTIPEAVQLVLQAAVLHRGGEVFELDMGKPVRIVDLARDFIRLSGRVPGRDVAIEFTGVRPGEKLFEELYCLSETVAPTRHPKVFCVRGSGRDDARPAIRMCLDRLGDVDPVVDPVLAQLSSHMQRLLGLTASVPVGVS